MDSLAAEGLRFENAVSQSPWTTPSMASIMTSMYPSQLGPEVEEGSDGIKRLFDNPISGMDYNPYTLAEVLKEKGYQTECITMNPFASTTFGVVRGFDRQSAIELGLVTADAVDKFDEIIRERRPERWSVHKQPFFVYMHLMDVHCPTMPRPPFDTIFPAGDGVLPDPQHWAWSYKGARAELDSAALLHFKSHKIAFYDGAVRQVDSQLERLAKFLKEEGLLKNTIIVIAADHGEELWDHARFERERFPERLDVCGQGYGVDHGHTMFRELLDVPLIFRGPGVPNAVVDKQVRNLDIAPTLLGLAGIDARPYSMAGSNLVAQLRQGTLQDLPAFSENVAYGYEKKAYQDGRYKYFRYYKGIEREFLFDKSVDPLETNDISREQPEVTARMRDELDRIYRPSKPPAMLDEDTRRRLKSVGYLR